MQYNNISLNVLIKGKPITEYPHNGQVFIEGRDHSNFEIEVRNHNGHRVEAVISVDGLSVIDGKDAGPTSSGYVIDAHGSIRIPGWKLNDDQVAAFEFAGKRDSYSAAVNGGSTRNTGVLGVLAYKEKPQQHLYVNTFRTNANRRTYGGSSLRSKGIASAGGSFGGADSFYSSESFGSARGIAPSGGGMSMSCASPSVSSTVSDLSYLGGSNSMTGGWESLEPQAVVQQSLGTAFGESQEFATSTITFERGDLQAMIVLFYDDARGLKARGIDLSRRARRRDTQSPVAFPGMTTGCQPPAGWKG
jgi:hypothetical protein